MALSPAELKELTDLLTFSREDVGLPPEEAPQAPSAPPQGQAPALGGGSPEPLPEEPARPDVITPEEEAPERLSEGEFAELQKLLSEQEALKPEEEITQQIPIETRAEMLGLQEAKPQELFGVTEEEMPQLEKTFFAGGTLGTGIGRALAAPGEIRDVQKKFDFREQQIEDLPEDDPMFAQISKSFQLEQIRQDRGLALDELSARQAKEAVNPLQAMADVGKAIVQIGTAAATPIFGGTLAGISAESALFSLTDIALTDLAAGDIPSKGKLIGSAALGALIPGGLKTVGVATKFATSQLTGFAPDTLKQIVKYTNLFEKAQNGLINRESLAGKVGGAIDDRIRSVSTTGKQYDKIRNLKNTIKTPVNKMLEFFESRGIRVTEDNGLDFTNTNIGDIADVNAIQRAWNFVIEQGEDLTASKALNLRGKIDDTINFESKSTTKGQSIVQGMRKIVDDDAKAAFEGLEALDAKFSPEIKELKKLKRDWLNSDGTLKDNAMTKIATLTGKGKEKVLERVEKISPGISKEINALRALEDVEASAGNKVGAYAKGLIGGGIVGGPVGAVVGAILANPTVATTILKAFGRAQRIPKGIIKSIQKKLGKGEKLAGKEKEIMEQAIQEPLALPPAGGTTGAR